jgi:riboflavin biosynthesis pyrimidine reductase
MAPSVDGRIVTRGWPALAGLSAEYERTAAALRVDAWIIGRVSMEPYAGKAAVLRKLRQRFGIRRLLLEGGGKINGSFLAADAVDELSLLVAPVADGAVGTPTLFDAPGAARPARRLELASVERRRGGLLWIRYRVRRGAR